MKEGNVPFDDMSRTFNLGIGIILIIDKNNLNDIETYLSSINESYNIIGEISSK